MSIEVKVIRSPLQVHGEDEAHQPKVVVAVQVADKNMIDAVKVRLKAHELHLRGFPAVDKEIVILDLEQLRGRMPAIGWQCTTRTQDGDLERQAIL